MVKIINNIRKRFPNAVLRIYFIAFNLTILVFNYKVAFSLSVGDLKVFINASRERRLVRRIDRDMKERARTYESIIEQYFATVQPMYEEIIAPSMYYADIVVNNEDNYSNKSIDVLASVLLDLLHK